MKFLFQTATVFLFVCILACSGEKQHSKGVDPLPNQKEEILKRTPFPTELIEAHVPYFCQGVRSNGKLHFNYELNIANSYIIPFQLSKIEVVRVSEGEEIIASFDSLQIEENLLRPGLQGDDYRLFSGNQYGIMNLALSISDNVLPKQVFHRLYFQIYLSDIQTKEVMLEKALISLPKVTELTIAPPFRSGNWFFYTSSHSNTRDLTEGRPSFAQRFAIDWVRVDENGLFRQGERNVNESYNSYGQELLAVADGIVTDIQDGIIENAGENEKRAIKINRYNLSGNHVILDIGDNVHVVYAHLIPGSLRVKMGDTVKKGDVLGLLGNSGESTGPHLHLHLESKHKLLLGGEGLAFHLEKYHIINQYDDHVNVDSLFATDRLVLSEDRHKKENEFPMGIGVLEIK